MLKTENLNKHFGGIVALENLSIEFPSGQVTAVVGPNGAGKTTLFNVIAGFVKPDSGRVRLIKNRISPATEIDLTGREPHQIARAGVGVLFQDIRIFRHLSALENVAVGMPRQLGEKPLSALFHVIRARKEERENLERASAYLRLIGLAAKAHVRAESLSHGEQKLVALARLLAADADILLLDEPTAGIHPDRVQTLLGLIASLAANDGKVIIIVEHNLNAVREIGDLVYLMVRGRVENSGPPAEILSAKSLQNVLPSL